MFSEVYLHAQPMQIFVNDCQGKTRTISCDSDDEVQTIKNAIFEKTNISPEEQLLSFSGKPLRDRTSISNYGISNGSTIDLSLKLLGGLPAEKTLEKYIRENMKLGGAYLSFQNVADEYDLDDLEDKVKVRSRILEMVDRAHHITLSQNLSLDFEKDFFKQINAAADKITPEEECYYQNLRNIANTGKHKQTKQSKQRNKT